MGRPFIDVSPSPAFSQSNSFASDNHFPHTATMSTPTTQTPQFMPTTGSAFKKPSPVVNIQPSSTENGFRISDLVGENKGRIPNDGALTKSERQGKRQRRARTRFTKKQVSFIIKQAKNPAKVLLIFLKYRYFS